MAFSHGLPLRWQGSDTWNLTTAKSEADRGNDRPKKYGLRGQYKKINIFGGPILKQA